MVTNLIQTKIKPMTREQIVISVDRLTRFKPTYEKYLRVFKDIILNNLIYPTFKKKDLDEMDCTTLTKYAQEVLNYSLKELAIFDTEDNFSINKNLEEYENSIFNNDEETRKLLNNNISYKSVLRLLNSDDLKVKNLLWLSKMENSKNATEIRESFFTHFPISKIIIAEGITEEILLPIFAKTQGVDFDKFGYHIISAGGKNQVVKLFYSFAEILKIPVFILLDNDASENFIQIQPKIRNFDKIHLIQSGEFEDLLPIDLVIKSLNNHLKNLSSVEIADFDSELSMVENLEKIYHEKGLEDFKKADFAHIISENITNDTLLSNEIMNIINELQN